MAYYLRKENKKKGTYLQMYESHWDKEKKQPRSKSVMAFGYVHELISDEIPDPVSYYTHFVAEKNKERAAAFTEETRPRAFVAPVEYNLGQFLLYTLLDPFSVVVLGNFRRFLPVIFSFLFLHLDFSFIYSKFSMPFWGFFY